MGSGYRFPIPCGEQQNETWDVQALTRMPLLLASTEYREEDGWRSRRPIVIERICSKGGAEMANRADNELPDKVDTKSEAGLLEKYGLSTDELSDVLRGQSPSAG